MADSCKFRGGQRSGDGLGLPGAGPGQSTPQGVPMKHYFFRLISPRPSFPADMTPAEATLMREHSAYWSGLIAQGLAHAVGPVFDPKGPYGIAIASLDDA